MIDLRHIDPITFPNGGYRMKKAIINCLRVNIKDNVVTLIKEITVDEELIGKDVPSVIIS